MIELIFIAALLAAFLALIGLPKRQPVRLLLGGISILAFAVLAVVVAGHR